MRLVFQAENYRVACFRRSRRRVFLAEKFGSEWQQLNAPGPKRIFVADHLKAALKLAQQCQAAPVT